MELRKSVSEEHDFDTVINANNVQFWRKKEGARRRK